MGLARQPRDPAVKPMPDETWGSVTIDQGRGWAAHEPTRRIADLAMKSGVLEASDAAWKELAGLLEMNGPEAFDALLGERASLVWGKPNDLSGTPWGVVTRVSDDNLALLERRFDAAPRGFDQGRSVILVERGKFRLSRLDARDGLAEVAGWPQLVLSPADGNGNRTWIARTLDATDGLGRKPGAIVGYLRADESGSYAVASITKEDRGWDATIRCTPEAIGLTRGACDRLAKETPVSDVVAGDDVLLEVWGRVPAQVPGLARVPAEVSALLTAARITAPSARWSGERLMLRVVREGADGFSVLVACEVKDRREASAWFDGMITGVLDLAGRVQGTGGQVAAELRQDLVKAGNDPAALRLVVLGGRALREKGRDPQPVVDPGTLAWTTAGEGAGGWWVMQYRSGAAERDTAESRLRSAAAEVTTAAWGNRVAAVAAKPALLWKLVGGAEVGEQAGLLGVLTEVETVESSLVATVRGVEGSAKVRMVERTVTPAVSPVVTPPAAPEATPGPTGR